MILAIWLWNFQHQEPKIHTHHSFLSPFLPLRVIQLAAWRCFPTLLRNPRGEETTSRDANPKRRIAENLEVLRVQWCHHNFIPTPTKHTSQLTIFYLFSGLCQHNKPLKCLPFLLRFFFPPVPFSPEKIKKQHRCLHGTALLPTVCYIRFNTQVVDVFSSNKCCSRKDETFLYLLYIYYVWVFTSDMYIWTMNICWNHHLAKLTCSCDHI